MSKTMKSIEVTVDGVAYPCRPTMGAMLRFKQETGKEATEIDGGSISDICAYLWCCVVSACKKDGREFNMSLMDFADSLDTNEVEKWGNQMTEEAEEQTEAKKKKRP